MPAQKAHRQSVKRYARNLSVRRATRTAIGRARRAIATGAPESAEEVHKAMRQLDIAARKECCTRTTPRAARPASPLPSTAPRRSSDAA